MKAALNMNWKSSLTLLILLISVHSGLGQDKRRPILGVVVEQSVAGTLLGGYAGYNVSKHWVLGAFYEDRLKADEIEFNKNYYLAGIFANYVIFRDQRMDLSVLARTGFKGGRYIFVVPSLVAGFRINRYLEANFMASYRSEFPSIGLSVFTNFNFSKDE